MNAPLIRLAQPALDEAEAQALGAVLASGMLVQGKEVERFERAVAERCHRKHAVAVTNGTAALELALRCLDVKGHEVLVPSLTWPSPAHAALEAGGEVALSDVDAASWNITGELVRSALSPRTRVVIAIDQFGSPADLPSVLGGAGSTHVVEDAACAIGSTLGGAPCGSFGILSTLSFHPRKVITTGEGGMLLTDEPELAARARMLRNHGQEAPGVFGAAGPNLRLTELQAAMGSVQLGKLDAILKRRREIAARYREALPELSVQAQLAAAEPNAQTFGVILEGIDPKTFIARLAADGIECGRLSYALGTLPSLAGARRAGTLAVSERLVAQGIALPLHTRMTDEDVERVIASVARAVSR